MIVWIMGDQTELSAIQKENRRNADGTRGKHRQPWDVPEAVGTSSGKTVGMREATVSILLETLKMPLVLKKQFQNFREKQKRHPCEWTQECRC